MNGCKNCAAYAKCTITDAGYRGSRCAALRWTYGLDSDPEITTNADRIRAMSDEELGVFLCGIAATNCCGSCMVQEYCYTEHNGFADWLRQPVKDGDNE